MKKYKLLKIMPEQHKRIRVLAASKESKIQTLGEYIVEAGLKIIERENKWTRIEKAMMEGL